METKNRFIAFWDALIAVLVFISIFLIFYFYFEISPEEIIKINKIHLIITLIFVMDVFIRIALYKFEYIKSSDIIIDILSCIDILGPVLKPLKLMRFARLIRIVRLFRVMKLLRFFEIQPQAMKVFNIIGFSSLILFILLGNFLSSQVKSDYLHLMKKNYEIILENAIKNNSNLNNKLEDINGFVDNISKMKNVLSIEIRLAKGNFIYDCVPKEFVEKNYNDSEDSMKIVYNYITLNVATKHIAYISSKTGYYTLLTGVCFYFLLFLIFYFVYNKKEANEETHS